ncbi:BTAD domain-containing putative transcriptional regulator [Longispora sp. K20-0274]|uniref:AfsR/SARP family transcriptional regulator n=1 Tax=Longispora sp. K20-0274 TaxID=3088255 RepID=UPI00399BA7B2
MEFQVLGTVLARVDGEQVELGRRRLERCLLGILLLELGTTVTVDRLTDLLWGDRPPERSRPALQVLVSRLRGSLAATGAEEHGVRLLTRGGGYVLEGDPDRVDAHRFRRLCEQARTCADPADRLASLRRALTLWQGPPLGDAATDRVRQVVVPALEELYLDARELLFDAHLDLGQHTEVIGEAGALLAEHPHRERLAGHLMLALHRAGRRQDALDVFATARREHGGPGPALRELHRRILCSDPALSSPSRVPATAQPPAGPPVAAPALLPPAVPDFTGRQDQLDTLDRLTGQAGAVVISTIGGVGGVGKTALALYWAHRARHTFPDGQLHINLHGYSAAAPVTPAEALSRFLRALGVRPENVPADLDEAAALYRSRIADRRMLVVLDNARSADQVRPLLPSGPGSVALVTSRDRLAGLTALDGARRLTLEAMTPDEALALLGAVIGPERVAADPSAAARLVGLCGRLPLAIRITAAQLAERPQLGLARHVAELEAGDRLAALALPEDDDASVRVVFGHSYTGLKPEAARLFRLLGLVPGPDFGVACAAALAGLDRREAGRLLNILAAAHLIEPRGADRYGFHDLMRLYAADQAGADPERDGAVRRFYHWYVLTADAAAWLLSPDRLHLPIPESFVAPEPVALADREQALAWCDAEGEGFVAAVTAPPEGTDPEAVWLLAESTRFYFLFRMFQEQGLAMAQAALSAARDCQDPRVLAAMHYSVATQWRGRENHTQAHVHYDQALTWARRSGLPTAEAIYLIQSALSLRAIGRLHEAADRIEAALPLFALNEADRDGVAVTQSMLAHIYRNLGRYAEAMDLIRTAFPVIAELRPLLIPVYANYIACIYIDLGEHDQALAHLDEALRTARTSENSMAEGSILNELGGLYQRLGQHDRALEVLTEALEACIRAHDSFTVSEARSHLALTLLALGRPAEALDQATSSVQAAGPQRLAEVKARIVLARVLLDTGDREDAVRQASTAVGDCRSMGYRLGLARGLAVLGEATGDPAHTAESEALHLELGVPYYVV